jgi:ribonuclease P protein component
MIPFRNRFHGHNSLRFVYKNVQAVRSRFATLKSTPNLNRTNPRIAVVISKKVLKSAVRRNRIRRRIYDYIHNQLPRLDKTYDIVMIVTSSELHSMQQTELIEQLEQLFTQSHLYKSTKN